MEINKENVMRHLKEDQQYPAVKEDLVKTCNSLSDFSKEEKQWFEKNLPSGMYNSPEEVAQALKM